MRVLDDVLPQIVDCAESGDFLVSLSIVTELHFAAVIPFSAGDTVLLSYSRFRLYFA
jgi:hypothetical protein